MINRLGTEVAEENSLKFDASIERLIYFNAIKNYNLTPKSTIEEIYKAVELETVGYWYKTKPYVALVYYGFSF